MRLPQIANFSTHQQVWAEGVSTTAFTEAHPVTAEI